jgi:choline-sulfatase
MDLKYIPMVKIKTKLWAGWILLLALIIQSCQEQPLPGPQFRNVVVIISDDHSSEVAGCYGNSVIRTPNIDRIASGGIRFTNAYANAPICSASRQSLLTGKYPHASGVNLLFTPFNDEMNYTMAEHFRSRGIATAMVGKTHWNDWIYWSYWDQWPDFGFDTVVTGADWRNHIQRNPPTPIPEHIPTRANTPHGNDIPWQKNAQMLPVPYYDRESTGTFLAKSASDFIRDHSNDRFFLWVAFHEPHAPFQFPVEFAGSYDPDSVPLPEGGPEDDRWVPGIFRDLTEQEKQGIIASYYTSVEYMDKNVGLILDELEASGVDDQTLVVYLGDQGYLLNDHSRFEKHTMWAESIKAPFIMKGKGLSAGSMEQQVVEFVDLAPTLFEAMGIDDHDALQGYSLFPLLTNQVGSVREYAFAEYLEDNMAMVASQKWKYVFTTGKRDLGLGYATGLGPSGVVQMLYDLEDDPDETTNLAYMEEFSDMVDSLQSVMLGKFTSTHPMAEYVPSGLNRTGKLIWFCEPNDVGEEPGSELQRIFEKEDVYE